MHVSIEKDRDALDVSDNELAEIHAIVTRLYKLVLHPILL